MHKSHGSGKFTRNKFKKIGTNVILENGVLIFHPENIIIEDNVYIGHNTILKAYYKNYLKIGAGSWIGQQCFFHSAGGITIGNNVGIGPAVKILTSFHSEEGSRKPILYSKIKYSPVVVEDDADIGINAVILPGITIGKGAQIGAGAVVTKNVAPYSVVAGVPAKKIKMRII